MLTSQENTSGGYYQLQYWPILKTWSLSDSWISWSLQVKHWLSLIGTLQILRDLLTTPISDILLSTCRSSYVQVALETLAFPCFTQYTALWSGSCYNQTFEWLLQAWQDCYMAPWYLHSSKNWSQPPRLIFFPLLVAPSKINLRCDDSIQINPHPNISIKVQNKVTGCKFRWIFQATTCICLQKCIIMHRHASSCIV